VIPDAFIKSLFEGLERRSRAGTLRVEGAMQEDPPLAAALAHCSILIGWYYRATFHAVEVYTEKGQSAMMEVQQGI
jgi:hypothetical protein